METKCVRLNTDQRWQIRHALSQRIDWLESAAANSFACSGHDCVYRTSEQYLADAAMYLNQMRICAQAADRVRGERATRKR